MIRSFRVLKGIQGTAYRRLSFIAIIATFLVAIGINYIWRSPEAYGEWDDLSLITVSIINDGNVTINEQDIAYAKVLMPEWAGYLDNVHLSGYYAKNGDSLSWYFPLFSAMCVPIMLILKVLGISGIYTFSLCNILLYLFALLYVYFCSDFLPRIKFWLILVLCVNPIILYTLWVSGEVFIFSFLLVSLICWQRKRYCRAAVYLSVASTLNPAVLVTGIVMIAEYLYCVIRETGVARIWKRSKDILLLAACFLPALLPFAWNLYQVGHINMTAATEMDASVRNIIDRFGAYLFDFNLGLLPYYAVLLLLFLIAVISAVRKHQGNVLVLAAAFVGTCLVYSMEVHINCGMSGLARYNVWAVLIIIVAVFVWWGGCAVEEQIKAVDAGMACSVLWTAFAVASLLLTNPICYREMTPIAKVVLEYVPQLYNPLPDIFNCRVNHVDQIGYESNLPIIYRDGNWQCRKILASYEDKEYILQHVSTSDENMLWLSEKLDVKCYTKVVTGVANEI